ncbi:FAD binding domain-containing protein [Xylariaceae sp. FL0804]|nr:FAD binding domain-containing protein [Xylariaceae sp. FL0804]
MAPAAITYEDLVIIGAGPAGLVAALWALQYGIKARVIEIKQERISTGHADGLTCRTLEILDSFGLARQIYHEAALDYQIRYWRPNAQGEIERAQSLNVQSAGVSRFQACLLSQARVEELLEEKLSQSGLIRVERGVRPWNINITTTTPASPGGDDDDDADDDDDQDASYPVSLDLHHADSSSDPETTAATTPFQSIRAKYVIAADGAHSWTRRALGLAMRGEQTQHVWGVVDLVPGRTDFPDVRQTCVVCSRRGNVHLVPRERGMVRLYVQLDDDKDEEAATTTNTTTTRGSRAAATLETVLAAARAALRPFRLESQRVDWFSVYRVGQRVADRFCVRDRVFLVGDAIHTHSPKVGQGMNVSMQDSYNLGWKICSVLRGRLPSSVLATYESERRPVAQSLIRADRETVAFYAARDGDGEGIATRDLQAFRARHYAFLSGVAVQCDLVLGIDMAHPPKGMPLGQRMPSFRVIRHADARPVELAEALPSDGRWRLVVFAGDVRHAAQMQRIARLGEALADASSLSGSSAKMKTTTTTTTTGQQTQSRDDDDDHDDDAHRQRLVQGQGQGHAASSLWILSSPRADTPLLSLPFAAYHAAEGEDGCVDYERVYTDEPDVYGVFTDAYARYGVDRERGCVVLCRPDQHVAFVGELEAMGKVTESLPGVFKLGSSGVESAKFMRALMDFEMKTQ